jgi:phage gpG-like protein
MSDFLQIVPDFASALAFVDRLGTPELADTMSTVASALVIEVQDHFNEQESPEGTFTALSEKYAKRKAKLRPGKKILFFDDVLYGSIAPTSTSLEATAGPRGVIYAARHNFGLDMPKREYAWIREETMQELEEHILDGMMSYAAEEAA